MNTIADALLIPQGNEIKSGPKLGGVGSFADMLLAVEEFIAQTLQATGEETCQAPESGGELVLSLMGLYAPGAGEDAAILTEGPLVPDADNQDRDSESPDTAESDAEIIGESVAGCDVAPLAAALLAGVEPAVEDIPQERGTPDGVLGEPAAPVEDAATEPPDLAAALKPRAPDLHEAPLREELPPTAPKEPPEGRHAEIAAHDPKVEELPGRIPGPDPAAQGAGDLAVGLEPESLPGDGAEILVSNIKDSMGPQSHDGVKASDAGASPMGAAPAPDAEGSGDFETLPGDERGQHLGRSAERAQGRAAPSPEEAVENLADPPLGPERGEFSDAMRQAVGTDGQAAAHTIRPGPEVARHTTSPTTGPEAADPAAEGHQGDFQAPHADKGAQVKTLNMKLYPPSLAPLRVRVQVRGEEVRALFLLEGQEMKHVVETGLPGLRDGLVNQGLSVKELGVQVGAQSGNQTPQHHAHHDTPQYSQTPYTNDTAENPGEGQESSPPDWQRPEGRMVEMVI